MNQLALPLSASAVGPVVLGGIIAARTGDLSAVAAAPAVVFGVVAATCPALYIAIAALGDAPPLAQVARAFAISFGAFGIVLTGLILPAAFLSLSSVATLTTFVVCTAALGGAALIGIRRLFGELATRTFPATVVFITWAAATLGIAGGLWWDVASEVLS